jgi:HK97 family phage prohead protease
MDHDLTRVIGSTDDELELHSDERGLAFRLHFPGTRLGEEAKRLVIEKEYMGMSVGCKYQYRTETIGGEAVQVIHSAALEEISLVRVGAIGKAFATLTTADRPLIDDCRTGILASDGAFVELIRACQRAMAALR